MHITKLKQFKNYNEETSKSPTISLPRKERNTVTIWGIASQPPLYTHVQVEDSKLSRKNFIILGSYCCF